MAVVGSLACVLLVVGAVGAWLVNEITKGPTRW
jgi:hypothetical protein